jgi:hypothetical protein
MKSASDIGWLRGPEFDFFFIVGLPVIAIASGLAVVWNNDLFLPVLAADLWILGYHHVVSTYTRLAFDKKSFAEYKALIVYLFPAVAATVLILVAATGIWVVPTIYLYWQWWHYTRQSEGISKAYAGKAHGKRIGDPRLVRATFYAVPVTGILAVSNGAPGEFLFFPLKTFPIPDVVLTIAFIGTGILLTLWIIDQIRAWRIGQLGVAYVMYVLSHYVIYFVAYVYIDKINYGWLVINIWHNAQYILFVWLYNNRRFGGKVDPESPFLSTISQNGRFLLYFSTCLTISTFAYFLILHYVADALGAAFALTAGAFALIIYQTINFHHYIVDSIIWKLRKKRMRANLGLT